MHRAWDVEIVKNKCVPFIPGIAIIYSIVKLLLQYCSHGKINAACIPMSWLIMAGQQYFFILSIQYHKHCCQNDIDQ